MFGEQASGLARAGDDVHDAGRKVNFVQNLREAERGERGCLGGLEDAGVAARKCRRKLPRRHEQWKVPRNDLRADADGLRLPAVEGVAQLVAPAGVMEEMLRNERQVLIARFLDGLAAI